MDDGMIDLMTGDAILRRRLLTYAELRLSPDVATSARIRARVLAVAHRRAELAHADAALTVVRDVPQAPVVIGRSGPTVWRRALTALLVATLALGAAAGTAFAAKAGGPLYAARLWAESVTLPSEPSRRAVAELERLQQRLAEASQAADAQDLGAVTAALEAYASIVDTASEDAIASGDAVASAILTTGVGHNVEVLEGLVSRVPGAASDAIARAVTRAIDHSDAALEHIGQGAGNGGTPPNGRPAGGPDAKPTKGPGKPAAAPTPEPTKKPATGGQGGGGQNGAGQPAATQQPDATQHPAKPDRTPRPTPEPQD